MIIDKIENTELYTGLNKRIKIALDYIKQTDFSKLELGKHNIENDTIYALLNEYTTKDSKGCLLEAHRKYIDVQYVVEGEEQVGLATLDGQKAVKEYDEKDDYLLYDEKHSLVPFKKGMFAIFFPDDLHLPEIKLNTISKVKKVIIKVKI